MTAPRPEQYSPRFDPPASRSLEWVLRLALAPSATTCPPRSCTSYRLFRARGRLFPACWFLFVDLEALRWPYELASTGSDRLAATSSGRRSATTTWTSWR